MDSSPQPVRKRGTTQVVVWAILLFLLTLLGALPLILSGVDPNKLSLSSQVSPLIFVGIELTAYAPTLAAILISGVFPGTGGMRALLRQVGTWRVNALWYLLALLGPIGLVLLAVVLHVAMGGAAPAQWFVIPSGFALTFFIGSLVAGSLGEEYGWRGFAQPRLQTRFGALGAAIVIGVLWTAWHNWPLITPGGLTQFAPSDFLMTLVRLTALAIIYAWMYNSTHGSLFLMMVAHAGHNLAANLVQIPRDGAEPVPAMVTLLYLAAAAVIVLMMGARTLARLSDNTKSQP